MAKVKLENSKSSRTNHIGKGGELRLVGSCILCVGLYIFVWSFGSNNIRSGFAIIFFVLNILNKLTTTLKFKSYVD